MKFAARLLVIAFAAPAAAHEWAGLGDSRFGGVEAVVPQDWRDEGSSGASAPGLGLAMRESADFADSLGHASARPRGLSAAGIADFLGVVDFQQNRRRWTGALAATALGEGGVRLAAPDAHGLSLAPWTYRRTTGVSASLDF